jgi:hypothetical protein
LKFANILQFSLSYINLNVAATWWFSKTDLSKYN